MKTHPDTFGLYLMDAHRGKNVLHIIERDDGHINANPNSTRTYLSDHPDWPPAEQQAIAYAHGTVLDLGCGAGRHSLHIQRLGHRVLAADISPLAVKVAEERGVKHATVADASTIEPGEMIDTVLLLGNGFGVYGTPQNAKHQLTRLHGFTSDDATVIMDTVDPHATDNPSHTEYHRKNIRQNRLVGQIRLRHRHQVYASPWFDFFMTSIEETRAILEDTGWSMEQLINPQGPHYWATLKKK